jgi:hypothetical protein
VGKVAHYGADGVLLWGHLVLVAIAAEDSSEKHQPAGAST